MREWRHLTSSLVGTVGVHTVKVAAHTMKRVQWGWGFDNEGNDRVHIDQCGLILDDDFDHIHHLRITGAP